MTHTGFRKPLIPPLTKPSALQPQFAHKIPPGAIVAEAERLRTVLKELHHISDETIAPAII
jgi:hypothetical protein